MRRLLPVLCALSFIFASLGFAQELDPLLAPHAERYNLALEDLKKTVKTQLTARETEYVQKLDAAIARAKDEAAIDALRKEREGVVKGLLASAKSAPFPEEVIAARNAFLSGASKASLE